MPEGNSSQSVVQCNALVMKNKYIVSGSIIGGIPSGKLANIVLSSGTAPPVASSHVGAEDLGEKGPLLV